jgi:type IV secretory pathway VirB10-like protein
MKTATILVAIPVLGLMIAGCAPAHVEPAHPHYHKPGHFHHGIHRTIIHTHDGFRHIHRYEAPAVHPSRKVIKPKHTHKGLKRTITHTHDGHRHTHEIKAVVPVKKVPPKTIYKERPPHQKIETRHEREERLRYERKLEREHSKELRQRDRKHELEMRKKQKELDQERRRYERQEERQERRHMKELRKDERESSAEKRKLQKASEEKSRFVKNV